MDTVSPKYGITRRGKLVTFYRNGDAYDKGLQTSVSGKHFTSMHCLMSWLDEKVPTNFGVHRVFRTPDGGEIKDVGQFQSGCGYVVSSNRSYINVKYGNGVTKSKRVSRSMNKSAINLTHGEGKLPPIHKKERSGVKDSAGGVRKDGVSRNNVHRSTPNLGEKFKSKESNDEDKNGYDSMDKVEKSNNDDSSNKYNNNDNNKDDTLRSEPDQQTFVPINNSLRGSRDNNYNSFSNNHTKPNEQLFHLPSLDNNPSNNYNKSTDSFNSLSHPNYKYRNNMNNNTNNNTNNNPNNNTNNNTEAGKTRVIELLSNTNRNHKQRVLYNPQSHQCLEDVLRDVGESILPISNPPVTALYTATPPYEKVTSLSHLSRELSHNEAFIVCGVEVYPNELIQNINNNNFGGNINSNNNGHDSNNINNYDSNNIKGFISNNGSMIKNGGNIIGDKSIDLSGNRVGNNNAANNNNNNNNNNSNNNNDLKGIDGFNNRSSLINRSSDNNGLNKNNFSIDMLHGKASHRDFPSCNEKYCTCKLHVALVKALHPQ